MLSKSIEKYANSLKQKKYRHAYKRFIAEGEKTFNELIDSNLFIERIIALPGWIENNNAALARFQDIITVVSEQEMKRISSLVTSTDVLLIVQIPDDDPDDELVKKNLNLVIANVQDPGNVGTMIRIADWFGIPNVFCSEDSADPFSPKVVQATMGSIGRVKVFETDIPELIQRFPSVSVYGTLLEGDNIFTTKLTDNGFIIIGNEARGIPEPLIPLLDKKISIPRIGKAESLNAAVATGIVCAEFRRSLML